MTQCLRRRLLGQDSKAGLAYALAPSGFSAWAGSFTLACIDRHPLKKRWTPLNKLLVMPTDLHPIRRTTSRTRGVLRFWIGGRRENESQALFGAWRRALLQQDLIRNRQLIKAVGSVSGEDALDAIRTWVAPLFDVLALARRSRARRPKLETSRDTGQQARMSPPEVYDDSGPGGRVGEKTRGCPWRRRPGSWLSGHLRRSRCCGLGRRPCGDPPWSPHWRAPRLCLSAALEGTAMALTFVHPCFRSCATTLPTPVALNKSTVSDLACKARK